MGGKTMRHLIVKAGGLVGAAGATLLLAGGGFAVASGGSHTSVTGPEVVSGVVHGKAALANTPHIPLTLIGVVATTDRGFVLGNGSVNHNHTLSTAAGKLTVKPTGKQHDTQSLNARTCRVSFIVRQQIAFVPNLSTGKFAGATGPGAYQITFSAFVPRYTSGKNKGQCNASGNVTPLAKGAVATFLAAGVITVAG
jgi:hypothetical protein